MLNVLFYFCFSAMVVASLPYWWKAFKQKSSGGPLMDLRPSSGSPIGLIDVIAMFLFWIVAQLVAISVIELTFGIQSGEAGAAAGDQRSWMMIVLALSQLFATFLAVTFFLIRYRRWSAIGLPWEFIRVDLKIGLLSFVMVIPAILFLQWLLVQVLAYEHPTMEMLAKNANGLTLVAAWVSAVIAAPVFEEVFFRGVLQSWLQRVGPGAADRVMTGGWDSQSKLSPVDEMSNGLLSPVSKAPKSENPYAPPSPADSGEPATKARLSLASESRTSQSAWPIVVSSVLFALAHVGQGPAPIPLFFFGLVLGYIFRRTNSIVPCIVLHMMLNAFSMFWFTLGVFFGDSDPTEFSTEAVSALPQILHFVFSI